MVRALWRIVALLAILAALTLALREPFADVAALVADGDAHAQAGEWTLAQAAYEQALAALPGRAALLLRLGIVQVALHSRDAARQSLAQAAAAPWTRARALAGLAEAEEDTYRAARLWAEALRTGRNDAQVLGRYAEYLWQRGDWEQARAIVDRWLSIAAEDEQARLHAVILLLLGGDPDGAATLLRGVGAASPLMAALSVGDAPASADFCLRVGVALLSIGEHQAARVLFARARNLAPDSPVAQSYYAYCLHLAGDEAGALGLLRDAAAHWPAYPLAWYFLGEVERDAGRFAAARGHYARLLALDPGNAAACVALADAYAADNLFADAEAWYVRATELSPQEGRFWLALAQFYVEHLAGVAGKGVAAARKAVSLLPGDPAAHDALGWALFLSGDMAAARESLEIALRLDGDSPSVQYHAGSLYYALGDRARAAYHLARVLDVQPDGRYAALARDLLRVLK
ncbi:MAG: tetratricopeptide repeat protein [Anaerolineae bacterium]|nr:tetratricopeptide repeat protein [Anaerolineae bacterium]